MCPRSHSCQAAQLSSKPKWGSSIYLTPVGYLSVTYSYWHLLNWLQTTELKQPDFRSTGPARAWGCEHVEGAFAGLGTHLGRATACPRFLLLCWGPMWCSHKLRPRLLTPDSGHEMHLMKFHFCFSAPLRLFCPLERKEGLKLRGQLDPTTDLATPPEEPGQWGGANGAEDETVLWPLVSAVSGTQSPKAEVHVCWMNE